MTIDPAWDAIHAERPWGTCPEPAMARWAMTHFGEARPRSNIYLLDIGCGYGAQTRWLDDAGFSVHAIDASQAAIERMRLRYTGGAVIGRHDVCDLSVYPDGLFHGAVDICCLQHVNDIDLAMAEIVRVLRPGGRLFAMMAGDTTSPSMASGVGFMRFVGHPELRQMFPVKHWAKINIGRQVNIRPENMLIDAYWIIDAERAGMAAPPAVGCPEPHP